MQACQACTGWEVEICFEFGVQDREDLQISEEARQMDSLDAALCLLHGTQQSLPHFYGIRASLNNIIVQIIENVDWFIMACKHNHIIIKHEIASFTVPHGKIAISHKSALSNIGQDLSIRCGHLLSSRTLDLVHEIDDLLRRQLKIFKSLRII